MPALTFLKLFKQDTLAVNLEMKKFEEFESLNILKFRFNC